jgi:DNA-binding PadR family transcriptional regulator
LTLCTGSRTIDPVTGFMHEPTFLILTALADGPKHGYGVVRDVSELSGGQVTLRPGTLYGALDRLAEQGLVEIDREEVVDGRLRRYYLLTDSGTETLLAEAQRRTDNAAEAHRRLRSRLTSRRPATRPATG